MEWKEFVNYLQVNGALTQPSVIKAFLNTPRYDFLPENIKHMHCLDTALSIGYDQTNSQPTVVAFMLELLDVQADHKVLDIGSGSGWTTALLAHIVGSQGRVTGVERIKGLVEFSKKNLEKYKLKNAGIHQAGKDLGIPGKLFDRILVSAAGKEVPETLVRQLKKRGIMVIPINDSIYKVVKDGNGLVSMEKHWGFAFVPLVVDQDE